MAISKKGLRTITVNNNKYYWKFNEKVFIIPNENQNSLLVIDFGWYDIFLFMNDKENRPPKFYPKAITPKFVQESILFALENEWSEGTMKVEYREGKYSLIEE
ncbi:hypothetical protein WAF17_05050 [Bernardetia sp. ABR2-2B]|uniref:hypothetical protein n=1 Tax=Bernardetia sp. ABR2-2B TaxID=3127472 RepID=UPI0030CC45FF